MGVVQPDFADSRAFLALAASNRDQFMAASQDYLNKHQLEFRIHQDTHTTTGYAHNPHKVPPLLNAMFAQWSWCVRSALDNAFYQIVVAHTGSNPPPNAGSRAFPFADTPSSMRSRKEIKGLPDSIIDLIDEMQPYNRDGSKDGSVLWWLHDIARKSRHREPERLTFRVFEASVTLPRELFSSIDIVDPKGLGFVHENGQLELFRAVHRIPGSKPEVGMPVVVRYELNIERFFVQSPESFRWRLEFLMTAAEGEIGYFIDTASRLFR